MFGQRTQSYEASITYTYLLALKWTVIIRTNKHTIYYLLGFAAGTLFYYLAVEFTSNELIYVWYLLRLLVHFRLSPSKMDTAKFVSTTNSFHSLVNFCS